MIGTAPGSRAPAFRRRWLALLLSLVALVSLVAIGGGCAGRQAATLPSRPEVVLHWQARNESRTYGYLVFRADRPDGPFLRRSAEIIHVKTDGPEAGSYTFVDSEVQPGRTYYYTLDAVQNNGQKSRFSGVLSKTVAR